MLALGPTSERPKADATITCVCLWERFWLRRDCLFPPTVAQIVFSACCGAAKRGIVVKVILASFACSTCDRSGSHCLFIFRLLSRFD